MMREHVDPVAKAIYFGKYPEQAERNGTLTPKPVSGQFRMNAYEHAAKRRDRLSMQELIGKGYAEFWNFKGRYRVCKGSRASKKSKTMALWVISQMMKYSEANMLVVRKVYSTLRDSCFKELKWAINALHVEPYWKVKENPLELTYLPTGQKVYFRGLDEGTKITSITVEVGVLCWCWIEESYEITSEADFDILDESIRGATPQGLFKQITLTLNPWSDKWWGKHRFFDDSQKTTTGVVYTERETTFRHANVKDETSSYGSVSEDGQILAMTTNYLCNEWLDDNDLKLFRRMKKNNPRRYQVAGLGKWGVAEGLVYERWEEYSFDWRDLVKKSGVKPCFGLDFGFANDPSALVCMLLDNENQVLYIFDELYERGLTNQQLYKRIEDMGYADAKIISDSADPKSIEELRIMGLYRIRPCRKGRDSIEHGIQTVSNYLIRVHPKCVNFLTEISQYAYETDKQGHLTNKPIDDYNHCMDAMRYGVQSAAKGNSFSFE